MREIALTVTAGESDVAGREELINLMAVKTSGGKYPFKLVSAPGKRLFTTVPTTPILGMFKTKSSDRAFVATASHLYEITVNGVVTDRGAWTMSGRVNMAENGTHLVAVDGLTGWVLTLSSNTLAQITDPDFHPADTVQFLNGFFIFNRSGTGQYFGSGLYSTSLDALDFATAESETDNIVTLIRDHNEIFLFGSETIETIYASSSGGDLPFVSNPTTFMEKGCAAKHTVAKINKSIYFVGNDRIVYELFGYTPVRISGVSIERDLKEIPLDSAFAYTYQEHGQLFYVLTLPPIRKTWVFDALGRTWHIRSSYADGSQGVDIGSTCMFFNNKTLVGDILSGNIYHLSRDYYFEQSQPIVRRVTLPTVSRARGFISVNSLEFDMKRGVGLNAGDDIDPVVWLRYSKDGGSTWIMHPDQPSIGRVGQFSNRIRFSRFGRAREFDFELSITHSVAVEIGGAFIDAS